MKIYTLDNVTRIAVVSSQGLVFEKYDLFSNGVELHLQDEGRTLKVFPKAETTREDFNE